MRETTTTGVNPANSVFQIHSVDTGCRIMLGRQLKRGYILALCAKPLTCSLEIEALPRAHFWKQELTALGHEA